MNNDVPRFLPILSAVSSVLMLFSTCLRAEDGGDLVATRDSELETEGRPRWYGPRVTVGIPSGIGGEPDVYVEIAVGRNLSWPEGWTLLHFCEPELLFGVANMWDEEDEHIYSFSAGPAITMRPFGKHVVLDIGSRPTYIILCRILGCGYALAIRLSSVPACNICQTPASNRRTQAWKCSASS
jgi:hypothetical protein